MKDRDFLFHERWLGLAQPIEGLVFSVPVLTDAQIAPDIRPELSTSFDEHLDPARDRIRDVHAFFRRFLGFSEPGMLVAGSELPAELSFYAAEGGQEIRPSFALGRGPFLADDPFAAFDASPQVAPAVVDAGEGTKSGALPFFALGWDLTASAADLDLDEPEDTTGPWRYSPTAKLERLLRHAEVPVGFLFNGRQLRLVYAPRGETTGHLTFRVEHLQSVDGRPLLAALELLLHARRAYNASADHTLVGLLAESRRRQADVTEALARQVFEAVEILVAGFEAASRRDAGGDRLDWLRPALEADGDHFYQGVLTLVLRLVFLFYAEDQSLLPVDHPIYAGHLSLAALHERLAHDAGAHPESMHHRFGAYGQLLALFRAVFFGVSHGTLRLPPRRGRLFDPNAYPFLEGGFPDWTAAVVDPGARAAAQPPSIDDGTIHAVLHRLVVFEGQRLSYRTLDVEQVGSVYESLMGYHVRRLESPAVRIGKYGVWVEAHELRAKTPTDRARFLKETCGLNPGPLQAIEKVVREVGTDEAALAEALAAYSAGRRADVLGNRADRGALILQPGDERRRTGSHYTPRWLTEKVVRRTLEPLLACLGEERTAAQILELKICDPAMGSGAFLVATCRELASEIVAAWTRSGDLARMVEEHGDAHLHARRLVAQTCLYGVDKNAAAVELAKLSLWLVTLSKTLPFTFVDHALRHGDSLVGLDFQQIEAFHWKPPGQVETCRTLLKDALGQAVALRQEIMELADHDDPTSQAEKRRLFEFSQQAIERVRMVADVCVGAFFAETKDAAREKERRRRLALVETWLGRDGVASEAARYELEHLATKARGTFTPFHWWIEFPEVFFEERPDPLQESAPKGAALMESAVGNPPYMGGSRITASAGTRYSDWLATAYSSTGGQTDLAAYFLRRSAQLIGKHGSIGLITTNSIAQGDTSESGLSVLLGKDYSIYSAETDITWPGQAKVIVSIFQIATNSVLDGINVTLNSRSVKSIDAHLQGKTPRARPKQLHVNKSVAGLGVRIDGIGFVLPTAEAIQEGWARELAAGALRPYLGGDDLNGAGWQHPPTYVIDLHEEATEASASREWTRIFKLAESRVKEDRISIGKVEWWRFNIPKFYSSYGVNNRMVLAAAIYARHLVWSYVPGSVCLNSKVFVFDGAPPAAFAVLQSRVHRKWAWIESSTIKRDIAYSAEGAFQSFPFPFAGPRADDSKLSAVGTAVHEARAEFVALANVGFTDAYNALLDPTCGDPRILDLRRLHEDMDRAVLAAYGWSDLTVPPFCPLSDADRTALSAFEDEVIDRLYVLNEERAREEARLSLSEKKRTAVDGDSSTVRPRARGRKKADVPQGGLF